MEQGAPWLVPRSGVASDGGPGQQGGLRQGRESQRDWPSVGLVPVNAQGFQQRSAHEGKFG